jgi:hypothetical protein
VVVNTCVGDIFRLGEWVVVNTCVGDIFRLGGWVVVNMCVGGIFRLGGWAVVSMCVGGIDFVSFWDFSIRFCNCSNSMVFFVFLDFVTVPTVWYFFFLLSWS